MAETAVQKTVKKLQLGRVFYANRLNNRSRLYGNNNLGNDNNRLVEIAQLKADSMQICSCRDLWKELCSYENIFLAYKKARKHKTTKDYVIKFEKNLKDNLIFLRSELSFHSYEPKRLVHFIIREPKTRKISKSDFRDRIVHHALCNIIEPILEKSFIFDSFANRIGKGTLKAIKRFDYFKRKASKNNTITRYILKVDIQKYFENIDHEILISVIKKKIADNRVVWLIRKILANHAPQSKGIPLGNLTSQFFANVYLNGLDWFVKSILKAKYYIRYVDDFVILESDKEKLEFYKGQIDEFLKTKLKLQLHKGKSRIFKLGNSINFLGFRVFYFYKLLKKSNLRKMKNMLQILEERYSNGKIDYDVIYDFIEGWVAYAKNADTYKLRKKFLADFEREFSSEISTKEINRYLNIQKKKIIPLTQMLERCTAFIP